MAKAKVAPLVSPTSVAELKEADYNPRYITQVELKTLKKSIEKYGDLSGVVFNARTSTLISGHQRLKTTSGKKTKIVKTAQEKDKQGTIAIGYIAVKEEDGAVTKIPYREVDWDNIAQEKAANIAANAAGGNFDQAKLGAIVAELKEDAQFDIESTGLNTWDIRKAIVKDNRSNTSSEQDTDVPSTVQVVDPTAMKFKHSCPKCGHNFGDAGEAESTKVKKSKKK